MLRYLPLTSGGANIDIVGSIGGSNQRLFSARSLLWHGKIDETILLFVEIIQAKT
jgi:hypothetical protein